MTGRMDDSCCRICLKSGVELIDVFSERLFEKDLVVRIYEILGVQVQKDDVITKSICKPCYYLTNSVYEQRLVALKNDVLLKEDFEKKKLEKSKEKQLRAQPLGSLQKTDASHSTNVVTKVAEPTVVGTSATAAKTQKPASLETFTKKSGASVKNPESPVKPLEDSAKSSEALVKTVEVDTKLPENAVKTQDAVAKVLEQTIKTPEPITITTRATVKAAAAAAAKVPGAIAKVQEACVKSPDVAAKKIKIAAKAVEVAIKIPEPAAKASEASEAAAKAPEVTRKQKVMAKVLETAVRAQVNAAIAPEVATNVPETITKTPEALLKTSKAEFKIPESTAKILEAAAKSVEVAIRSSKVALKVPEAAVKTPETVANKPKAGVKIPETAEKIMEAAVKTLENVTKKPKAAAKIPEAAEKIMEAAVKLPETPAKALATGGKEPDAAAKSLQVTTVTSETVALVKPAQQTGSIRTNLRSSKFLKPDVAQDAFLNRLDLKNVHSRVKFHPSVQKIKARYPQLSLPQRCLEMNFDAFVYIEDSAQAYERKDLGKWLFYRNSTQSSYKFSYLHHPKDGHALNTKAAAKSRKRTGSNEPAHESPPSRAKQDEAADSSAQRGTATASTAVVSPAVITTIAIAAAVNATATADTTTSATVHHQICSTEELQQLDAAADANHLMTASVEIPTYICQTCNMIFDCQKEMKEHQKNIHKSSLRCSKCSKAFSVVEKLVQHNILKHMTKTIEQERKELDELLNTVSHIANENRKKNLEEAKKGEPAQRPILRSPSDMTRRKRSVTPSQHTHNTVKKRILDFSGANKTIIVDDDDDSSSKDLMQKVVPEKYLYVSVEDISPELERRRKDGAPGPGARADLTRAPLDYGEAPERSEAAPDGNQAVAPADEVIDIDTYTEKDAEVPEEPVYSSMDEKINIERIFRKCLARTKQQGDSQTTETWVLRNYKKLVQCHIVPISFVPSKTSVFELSFIANQPPAKEPSVFWDPAKAIDLPRPPKPLGVPPALKPAPVPAPGSPLVPLRPTPPTDSVVLVATSAPAQPGNLCTTSAGVLVKPPSAEPSTSAARRDSLPVLLPRPAAASAPLLLPHNTVMLAPRMSQPATMPTYVTGVQHLQLQQGCGPSYATQTTATATVTATASATATVPAGPAPVAPVIPAAPAAPRPPAIRLKPISELTTRQSSDMAEETMLARRHMYIQRLTNYINSATVRVSVNDEYVQIT